MEYTSPQLPTYLTKNFSGNCGQKKHKQIDRKYIIDELQYTILHTNKGFLYSIKNIIKSPGRTAQEFIEGNRVNHYKPILLVFVLSGISTFFSFKILRLKEVMHSFFSNQKMNSPFMTDMMTFMSSYNSIFMLFLIPIFAFATRLSFRKWGHNYYEHIVMNAYILSFYTLCNILLVYPLMYLFHGSPDVFFMFTQVSILLVPLILVWFFKNFTRKSL